MTDHTIEMRAVSWRDGKSGPLAGLLYFGIAVALIGAAAFALSFIGVYQAALPYFGPVTWIIPLLGDLSIGVFTAFSITAEVCGLSSPTARWSSRLLIGFTIYANVAHEPGIYGRVLHTAPPAIWVLIVMTFEHLVRRVVGLNSPTRIEGLRKSLWLLRPIGTARIWRRMRVEAIATYREALDQDAARAAIVGRFRVNHGRLWRSKAPLSERIALRLQGRDPAGVAQILTAHAETAALLAAPAARSLEPAETVPDAASDSALRPLDPIVYPAGERPVLVPFAPFTAQRSPFAHAVKTLPVGGVPGGRANGEANAANGVESERDTAVRMRRAGASFQQIADALGHSKSWAYDAAGDVPIEHANGSAA